MRLSSLSISMAGVTIFNSVFLLLLCAASIEKVTAFSYPSSSPLTPSSLMLPFVSKHASRTNLLFNSQYQSQLRKIDPVYSNAKAKKMSTKMFMLPPTQVEEESVRWLSSLSSSTFSSSLFLLADGDTTESWRSYVPLVVTGFVLIDIVLGSPGANALLGVLRGGTDDDTSATSAPTTPQEGSEGGGPGGLFSSLFSGSTDPTVAPNARKKQVERIDSNQVAQAAIDKANSTLELRKFLDERKTDWDKMEEMKRQIDSDIQQVDDDIETIKKNREDELNK